MTTTQLATWYHNRLFYRLLDGHDLVGVDSGNVRRHEACIDGTQVGAKTYNALAAAPAEVQQIPIVAGTLSLGAYIDRH